MIRVMEEPADAKPWDEAMSGWRSNFVDAPTQLRNQRAGLLALVGRRLQAGWTGWNPDRDQWFSDIPLVLVFDGGVQLELAWQRWDALSITWNTIDLTVPPEIVGQPYEWRSSEPDPVAAIAGCTVTGLAVTESPYFEDADLDYPLPIDAAAGWGVQGLWIEFAGTGLHVYNGADSNGLSAEPARPEDDGHTRVTHRHLSAQPQDDAHSS
jgi:hypothetical protein